jgi:hypothetical protein
MALAAIKINANNIAALRPASSLFCRNPLHAHLNH